MKTNGQAKARVTFAKTQSVVEFPDLLDVQVQSFKDFLQAEIPPRKRKLTGLHQAFLTNFPIADTSEIFDLEFKEYYLEKPKYTVDECRERELTYAAALKARLRLSSKAEQGSEDWIDTVEQDVYLGTIPIMTDHGTFIINGAERVVVSQLHRSPGVFFSDAIHPNGTRIFTARIIPMRGSWVEFSTDINNVIFVYIDRKKKLPVTTLLRALGYGTDEELINLFGLIEEVSLDKVKLNDLVGRKIASDVVDTKTGEIFLTRDVVLTDEHIAQIKKSNAKKLKLFRTETTDENFILRTLAKDTSRTTEDALETIYRQLRSTDAPDIETARGLISKLFFNPKRYDLGEVGRFRMNDRLGVEGNLDVTTLTIEDIVRIVNYLIDMDKGKNPVDDIDHLGNRRVRTVGEQLAQQFNVGLARMARTIKERMNLHSDKEHFTPADLVNARTITSVVNSFFGTNQLSQFMDQTNPLAEMTHKRRMSALGPGGLTRERAGFEVRDVHFTHYGRLCPIETPEGPNIGLISSLCIHARVNDFGFIETPYRKVKNGKVTDEILYLTAEKEDGMVVAPANTPLDSHNRFVHAHVRARKSGDYVVVVPEEVDLIDVAPNQIVSAAAALIPFLEHDDANRALMGSNMQRQAVPLLRPESPYVGTGLEAKISRDSRSLIVAEGDGTVEFVDSMRIVVRYDDNLSPTEKLISFDDTTTTEYKLIKFFRTNQDTCINQHPVVKEGQRVKAGDVLADGVSSQNGELALGRNLLVAFMPWRGYNFEDAIIISERLVAEDVYTSIHIEEFTSQVRDTKRGEEEFTREIPNVSEEATKDLDENGIVRVGAEIKENDILIGKITPKGETDPTPEEKLLRAIFGDKAGDVKDASLKATPGLKGVVIETKLFSRKGLKKDSMNVRREDRKVAENLDRQFKRDLKELNEKLCAKLGKLLDGEVSTGIRDVEGKIFIRSGATLKENTFFDKMKDDPEVNFAALDSTDEWVEDKRKSNVVRRMFGNYKQKFYQLEAELRHEKSKLAMGDELQPGIMQMSKVYVAKKRKLSVGDKMSGRHGNKGVVAKIVPVEDMPFLPDGTPVDIILNPLGVPSRMNLGQLYETALGWAAEKLGVKFATPIFDGASWGDVQNKLTEAGLPSNSCTKLFDGRTGNMFDQEIMVGRIYMMKLAHLVDDKIHARSVGPYSLITQQPLGGKAQFGGQRFGEMEVWALEAYGASNTLQEMLTVKSDDVQGRSKAYESIVKGENLPIPNIPESFNVLIRELQGIALELKLE